jgi:hypothetical protein
MPAPIVGLAIPVSFVRWTPSILLRVRLSAVKNGMPYRGQAQPRSAFLGGRVSLAAGLFPRGASRGHTQAQAGQSHSSEPRAPANSGTVQLEAAVKKCFLVALVIPGAPLPAAVSARGGLFVRNRTG